MLNTTCTHNYMYVEFFTFVNLHVDQWINIDYWTNEWTCFLELTDENKRYNYIKYALTQKAYVWIPKKIS